MAVAALVLTGLTAANVRAAGLPQAPAQVPLPKDDPFYAAPDPIPALDPGSVVRSRPVTAAALGIPLPFETWQLMYVSRDAHDEPAVDVATIIKPLNQPATSPRPLVSYQTAEDSLDMHCAPSYRVRTGMEKEEVSLPPLLAQGWTVVLPDYEGLDSQMVAGLQAGHAVLDGIRAAQNFAPAGLAGVDTPVGLWGYSGGALASSWASELAPSYAPELKIVGVSEGGVPPNINHIADKIDGGAFSSIELAATVGLSRAYPELQTLLNEQGRQMAADIGTKCIEEYSSPYAFKTMDAYTTVPNARSLPWVQDILTLNRLGSRTPTAPLFVFHALNDEIIPVADANALVAGYCSRGVTVAYYQDPASEHISLAFSGAPAAISYLASRFAGAPAPNTCAVPPIAVPNP